MGAVGLERKIPGLADACTSCVNRVEFECKIQKKLVQCKKSASITGSETTTLRAINEIARLPVPPEGCPIK